MCFPTSYKILLNEKNNSNDFNKIKVSQERESNVLIIWYKGNEYLTDRITALHSDHIQSSIIHKGVQKQKEIPFRVVKAIVESVSFLPNCDVISSFVDFLTIVIVHLYDEVFESHVQFLRLVLGWILSS